jgi:hypothetical protein
MPDGNVQPSLPFTTYSVPQDEFPQELLGSIIPYIDANYRAFTLKPDTECSWGTPNPPGGTLCGPAGLFVPTHVAL